MGDLKAKLVDGKRQTLEDMEKESVINVQLYACHNKHNQEFEIVGSAIKSKSLRSAWRLLEKRKIRHRTLNLQSAMSRKIKNGTSLRRTMRYTKHQENAWMFKR